MPQISIRSMDGAARRVPLGVRTVIGRGSESHIRLLDRSLSRRHAEIVRRGEGCVLVDLGSTNGTFVNGARVPGERPLRDGDIITVGEVTLVYHADAHGAGARAFHVTELAGRSARQALDAAMLRHQNRVLSILSRASAALVTHHPLPELFDRILDLVMEAIPAERGAILLLEGDRPAVRAARGRSGAPPIERLSAGICERALAGEALLLADVLGDERLGRRPSIVADAVRSALCAPLWVPADGAERPRVLGLCYADTLTARAPLGEADLEVLTVLANVAAAKIETAHLLEEMLMKRRLEADLRLGAEIQSGVLPRQAPQVPGWEIAGATRPCLGVGGDSFDFGWDGARLRLALGDVSGKGLGAAMLTFALRVAVRAHWDEDSLARAVARINATFHQNVPDDRYATFFLARLEPATGRLRYVNAGHNRPLLARAGGPCEALDRGGTVVGAFPTAVYEDATATLLPGDTLLVFSDGVSDTWPDPDAADRALCRIARDGASAEAIVADVFRTLAAIGGLHAGDDRTVMVVRRLATSTSRG